MKSLTRHLAKLTQLVGAVALSGCGVEQAMTADAPAPDAPAEIDVVPAVGGILPEQFASASASDDLPVDGVDLNGAAWRVIEVPSAGSNHLETTPTGWLALSHREFSIDVKLPPSVIESALYRSRDGVHWQSIPLGDVGERLELYSLAYGSGHYVMFGRNGDDYVIWNSPDAEHWTEQPQPLRPGFAWAWVVYTGSLFFGLGSATTELGVSETGEIWESVLLGDTVPRALYSVNGGYVLTGNGSTLVSEDGRTWQRADAPPEPYPGVPVSGHFLGWSGSSSVAEPSRLQFWTSSGGPRTTLRIVRTVPTALAASGLDRPGPLQRNAPLPDRVDVEFDDHLDCSTATCVQVGSFLFLVPPLGTPPLPDRLPRRSGGEPLLTAQCPVSQMISCDDYGTRSGCGCNPQAPRFPTECTEVSQFGCAGAFSPRSNEWRLPEVARAGCSCDAIHPNQPLGFGLPCVAGNGACAAPFSCLSVDPLRSYTPPTPRWVCTSTCATDADCPTWEATGFCVGSVRRLCSNGTCQPRGC